KRYYNQSSRPLRGLLILAIGTYMEARAALSRLARLENPLPFTRGRKPQIRGMSAWHDLVDWVGGYPFEVARPEQVFDFYRERGFVLQQLRTDGGSGCNEYVFQKAG